MSNALPKAQQSAYQRWEMASFDTEPPAPAPVKADPGVAAAHAQALAMAAQQMAIVRELARLEGLAEGHAAGLAEGLEQGRAQAAQEQIHLQQIAASLGSAVAQSGQRMAEELLTLALDLARAMLKSALAVRPELVLPIVGEAVHYLPSLQLPALLFLHPDDAALVREHMGNELGMAGWRLVEDTHLERGGCRVETASNQIDGTLATRWQRLAAALGQNADWLAP
ncbi:MAG: flagellar assembly protein FliH [Pseudomonadota bacterium]